jgi:hypothetical protein
MFAQRLLQTCYKPSALGAGQLRDIPLLGSKPP